MGATRELLFIDPSVSGWQSIAASAGAAVRVVVLDSDRDGLEQIAATVAQEHGLAAIHIVSHGSAGQISLGNGTIDSAGLAAHAAALARIGASLLDGGDILLYGCDVAQGTAGGFFVQQLARATGADVAASTGLTGAAALGGDWTLEAQVGAVGTASLAARDYAGTLAIINGTSNGERLEGTAGADTLSGLGGDDVLAGGAGNDILDGGDNFGSGDAVDYSQGPPGSRSTCRPARPPTTGATRIR